MVMAKLSERKCAATKHEINRDILLGDGNGLYLLIRSGGTKVWVIDYLLKGIRRKVYIGIYDHIGGKAQSIDGLLDEKLLSLSQARLIAIEWKKIRKLNRDPAEERKRKKLEIESSEQAEMNLPTVNDAIKLFVAQHIEGKKSAKNVEYRLSRLAEHLGDKKISRITRKEFIGVIDTIALGKRGHKAKQTAGEVLTTAKRLWRYAETREWVNEGCIERLKRADFDARATKRDVVLEIEELRKIWQVLSNKNECNAEPVVVAALKILILTGQRENEVCQALWSEFDLDEGMWRLPAARTKTNRAHIVHLSQQAVEIIEGLKSRTGHTEFVFASPKKQGQAINGRSSNGALQILFRNGKLANVTPCHVHDFRRTLISRLPELGFESLIGNKIANHKLQGVLGHYNHAEQLPERKRALEVWANQIQSITIAKKNISVDFVFSGGAFSFG